jgi:hypothetical protein
VPVFGKPLTIIDVTGFAIDDARELKVQGSETESMHRRRGATLLNALLGTNFSASDTGTLRTRIRHLCIHIRG